MLAIAVLEYAAAHRDPLGDADETSTAGVSLAYTGSGVGDLDDHGPVHSLDRYRGGTGGGVLECVGEGLLDDPVSREVQIPRQLQPWIHREPRLDTGVVEPSDQLG